MNTGTRQDTTSARAATTRPIETVLSRLNRVQARGPGQWAASCGTAAHAHGDRSRGLSVSETPDGRVLLHCHAGCSVTDVVAALGLELSDLFPADPEVSRGAGRIARLSATHALEILRFEVLVLCCGFESLIAGTATLEELDRIEAAVARVHAVLGGAHVGR